MTAPESGAVAVWVVPGQRVAKYEPICAVGYQEIVAWGVGTVVKVTDAVNAQRGDWIMTIQEEGPAEPEPSQAQRWLLRDALRRSRQQRDTAAPAAPPLARSVPASAPERVAVAAAPAARPRARSAPLECAEQEDRVVLSIRVGEAQKAALSALVGQVADASGVDKGVIWRALAASVLAAGDAPLAAAVRVYTSRAG